MTSWFRQIASVTWMNIRNIPARPGSAAVAIFGVAAVVGVFAAVLSMATGFQHTMQAAGAEDVAIVLRAGATGELSSGLAQDQVNVIADAPGVVRDESGEPLASAELFVIVDIPLKGDPDSSANVPLRGVQPQAFEVRPNLQVVEGRSFEPGRHEMLVGRGAQSQFEGLEVGNTLRFGQLDWTVVGVFEDNGSVSESELWCDVRVLQPAYNRGNSYQSVRVRLESADRMETFEAALADDPRVNVDIQRESDYYAEQSRGLATFIRIVGYPLTILMGFGAIFGALNTMYTSVAARSQEIATLRALGFGATPVAIATLIESAVLSLIGGVIGAVAAYLIFNGYTVSTLNGASFSQVVFAFAVTKELLVQGLIAALVIGLIGGLFPAIRAARLPVVMALRES